MLRNRNWLSTLFALFFVAVSIAPLASASAVNKSGSIVGSWELVDDNTGDIFLLTYHGGPRRGTVNATSPDNSVSLTHGSWVRTGPRTFADTDIGFIYDENGIAALKIKFIAESELDESGDTARFNFEFEVTDLEGNLVDLGSSSGIATRIKVVGDNSP